MKLIDLLVKELPKRGGWPDGAEIAVQDADSQICFSSHGDVYANKFQTDWYGGDWGDGDWSNPFIDTIADDRHECIVSRKQYESALAASKNPAWNGEGLPPVGCECEYLDNNGKWYPVIIKYASDQVVVISGVTKILGVEQGTEMAKISSSTNLSSVHCAQKQKGSAMMQQKKWLVTPTLMSIANSMLD